MNTIIVTMIIIDIPAGLQTLESNLLLRCWKAAK